MLRLIQFQMMRNTEWLNLNTSHVKVNQDLDNITSSGLEYLNTSHVKVNL